MSCTEQTSNDGTRWQLPQPTMALPMKPAEKSPLYFQTR
jgi:hypothetical protein